MLHAVSAHPGRCEQAPLIYALLQALGQWVMQPFVQDTMQWGPLSLTMAGMLLRSPLVIMRVAAQVLCSYLLQAVVRFSAAVLPAACPALLLVLSASAQQEAWQAGCPVCLFAACQPLSVELLRDRTAGNHLVRAALACDHILQAVSMLVLSLVCTADGIAGAVGLVPPLRSADSLRTADAAGSPGGLGAPPAAQLPLAALAGCLGLRSWPGAHPASGRHLACWRPCTCSCCIALDEHDPDVRGKLLPLQALAGCMGQLTLTHKRLSPPGADVTAPGLPPAPCCFFQSCRVRCGSNCSSCWQR